MSFAVIDENCKYLELDGVLTELKKKDIPSFDKTSDKFTDFLIDTDRTRCIYFIKMEDSGLKYQIDFIKNTDKVMQWLIVLVDEKDVSEHKKNVAVSNFRTNIGKVDKDFSVICCITEQMNERIDSELQTLNRKKSNIVLIASANSFVGRKTTAIALNGVYPNKSFEICEAEDFEEKSKYAKHIVIVGNEISDFILPCPDDTLHRVTLLYNKADEAPINLVYFKKTQRAIISEMNKRGWDLPLEFNKFFVGSMIYDIFYQKLQSGEKDINEFKMNTNYYMWDKYGLPCPKEQYTQDNINSFLSELFIAPKLLDNSR